MISLLYSYWWYSYSSYSSSVKLLLRIFGAVIIPEDSVGIVNKKFVLFGSHRTLPDGAIIALQGEAGFQADTLPPGLHLGLWPWQFEITRQRFITIEEGCIGVIEARDGHALTGGRVLARNVECDSFQNARAFLLGNGERGPQITIMPPGTYRINTAIFTVKQEKALEISDNMVGIVTTKEGKPLPPAKSPVARCPDTTCSRTARASSTSAVTRVFRSKCSSRVATT